MEINSGIMSAELFAKCLGVPYVGNEEATQRALTEVKETLNNSTIEQVQEYLGCGEPVTKKIIYGLVDKGKPEIRQLLVVDFLKHRFESKALTEYFFELGLFNDLQSDDLGDALLFYDAKIRKNIYDKFDVGNSEISTTVVKHFLKNEKDEDCIGSMKDRYIRDKRLFPEGDRKALKKYFDAMKPTKKEKKVQRVKKAVADFNDRKV